LDHKKYGGLAENHMAMGGAGMVFGDTLIRETAGYGFVQQIILEKLGLSAGYRMEYSSAYGIEHIPSAGITFHNDEKQSLRASISKGFRSPTMQELYLWQPANPDLEPERMINYEIGLYNTFLKEKLTFDLAIFLSEGSNLIKMVFIESGPKFLNTGAFRNKGIEASTRYKINSHLSINANYSYLHMDQVIIASPAHQLYTGIDYRWKSLSLHASAQFIKDLFLQISPNSISEDYFLINARIKYHFNEVFNIFVKGENLSNQEYSINYKYPMPGIVFFAGINLSFKK